MKGRKWMSALLALAMVFALAVPAWADGETPEAPPPAMALEGDTTAPPPAAEVMEEPGGEDIPQEMSAEPGDVTAAGGASDEAQSQPEPETETEAAPESETAAAAQDVTVELSGAVEMIESITYLSPDSTRCYTVDENGVSYNTPEGIVWEVQSTGIPTEFTVAPGTELAVCMDPAYDLTADGGTVSENEYHSFPTGSGELISFRRVVVQTPASGTVTVTVTGSDGAAPAQVPFTFYNEDWDNGVIVGGGSAAGGQFAWNMGNTVITGGTFEVWTGPGYEIQVIEGGSIVRREAPSGPGAAYVPAASASFVLRVDPDAEQFVIAAVKEGETFTVPEEHPATGTFRDVPDDSWYKDAVEAAYASGVVTGTGEDTFSPGAVASRGQTVAMLYRQAGSPAVTGGVTFGDLTADYYKSAVDWASAVGAVNGTSASSFSPDSAVSRQQLAAMLYRMAGSPGIWSGGLADNYSDGGSVAAYAQSAMQWALDNGIITGYGDGTLRPSAAATRAEVCAMLVRYNEVVAMYPTQPVATPAPAPMPTPTPVPVKHEGRNLDNPKLIAPKREKIDDGIYNTRETEDEFYQQWSETFWGLDRSGEDIMWCIHPLARVRSGPGEEYDIVCTIGSGYEVSRLGGDENGWTQVVYHEYVTGEGFTGWDYTGYVPTEYLTRTEPRMPHVADFSSGEALKAWCGKNGERDDEVYYTYYDWEDVPEDDPFYHEDYTPVISGDTYTYAIRGGGKVTIHGMDPASGCSVETSAFEHDPRILLFVYLEPGYGITCPNGYDAGVGVSDIGVGTDCQVVYTADLWAGEDIEMTMFSGDAAPRVLQVTIKDSLGGSNSGDGSSRFVIADESGSWPAENACNFFNLKSGYALKSLSQYGTVGSVDHELHYFNVKNVPKGVDQIWFEVVRG